MNPQQLTYLAALDMHRQFGLAAAAVRPLGWQQPGLWLMQPGHCFRNQVMLTLCGPASPNGTIAGESGSIETVK